MAVGSTLVANQNLIAMAALPARWHWLFTLPPILVVVVMLMLAATVALWRWRQRSLAGRLYFTLLTLCAAVAAINLVLIGR